MIKKTLTILISFLLAMCLFGCSNNDDYTAKDVADSIANISSDSEGNVIINLVNGKSFTLGNLKGEKGDKGDKGDPGSDGKDGLNGLNGKDGVNGLNGKNGSNGKDGNDGSSITDYLKDVYVLDENQLVAKYGDDTTKIIKRFKEEGDYKLTIKYNLINEKFPELNTNYVVGVLYFDENDDIAIPIDAFFEKEGRWYDVDFSQELSDGLEITDLIPTQLSTGISGKMPSKDVEISIDYICDSYKLEFVGYYLDNNGEEQILYDECWRGYVGEEASGFVPYLEHELNLGFDSITLFKTNDSKSYEVVDSDVLLKIEYYPYYCNFMPPVLNSLCRIDYGSVIESMCIKDSLQDTINAVNDYFEGFSNVTIDVPSYVNEERWANPGEYKRKTFIKVDGVSLMSSYVQYSNNKAPGSYNKNVPIYVKIDLD